MANPLANMYNYTYTPPATTGSNGLNLTNPYIVKPKPSASDYLPAGSGPAMSIGGVTYGKGGTNYSNTPVTLGGNTVGGNQPILGGQFVGAQAPVALSGPSSPAANGGAPVAPTSGGQPTSGGPGQVPPSVPQSAGAAQADGPDLYEKYRDPKTGNIMTPEEYAVYLGNKIPKGNGEITNYAGDAMMNPNESAADLQRRATNLNNSRNDIATGTTDPYGVGNKSGIAYSPSELKAIENAYAGIYDPALNDVFARLEEKKKTEAQTAKLQEIIFNTNENIRQWRETTGSKSSGSGTGKEKEIKFSDTQLWNGASNAKMEIADFQLLPQNIKNFYINPPKAVNEKTGEEKTYNEFYLADIAAVKSGEQTKEEFMATVVEGDLPEEVKMYWIERLASVVVVPKEEKEGIFKRIWNWF